MLSDKSTNFLAFSNAQRAVDPLLGGEPRARRGGQPLDISINAVAAAGDLRDALLAHGGLGVADVFEFLGR